MTVAEFFGCTMVAFGPALAMFYYTITDDPIKIILLIFSSFVWLLALLLSSFIWFIFIPLRENLIFGVLVSILIQEAFRYGIYKLLEKTSVGLEELAGNSLVIHNKAVMAYVAGLGFGIISGLFQIVNILADAVGPGTMGMKNGSEIFFITSAIHASCIILLHTFWNIIFFNGIHKRNKIPIIYVVLSHLIFSCITFFNSKELYGLTLTLSLANVIITLLYAFIILGGSLAKLKLCIKTQQPQ